MALSSPKPCWSGEMSIASTLGTISQPPKCPSLGDLLPANRASDPSYGIRAHGALASRMSPWNAAIAIPHERRYLHLRTLVCTLYSQWLLQPPRLRKKKNCGVHGRGGLARSCQLNRHVRAKLCSASPRPSLSLTHPLPLSARQRARVSPGFPALSSMYRVSHIRAGQTWQERQCETHGISVAATSRAGRSVLE